MVCGAEGLYLGGQDVTMHVCNAPGTESVLNLGSRANAHHVMCAQHVCVHIQA